MSLIELFAAIAFVIGWIWAVREKKKEEQEA